MLQLVIPPLILTFCSVFHVAYLVECVFLVFIYSFIVLLSTLADYVLHPSVAPLTCLPQNKQITYSNSPISTKWYHWHTPYWTHIHTLSGWVGDWRECVYVWCSPGRPVFGEDLLSSCPPTPFRALPTSSSSPPPFSPSKPCSRQSSSSDTDLSLTPKTGKSSWPHPILIPPVSFKSLWCDVVVVHFFLLIWFIFHHFIV